MEQLDYIVEYIRTNRDQLVKEWKDKLVSLGEEKTDQNYASFCNEYINILLSHSMNEEEGKIAVFAQRLVEFGWTLTSIIDSVSEFGKIIFFHITGNASEKKQVEFVWGYDQRISPINNRLFNQYASSWQKTVSQQKIALQELSAPLIPVFDNISVMPLVGTIDTERAKKIMENLLEGVVKFRSQVVLIDITGVPVVDTMVAHHIIQASEAVRLVGAQCIIVGIRAEIAQTIVTLGINLDQVMTKSSLQKGILAALEMTNRKIVSMED
ncbi:STAS domain-containing protein [Bacillus salipaludis]|uniref:STAS domain-containing protein n=1 Tax=Bacillus salipaludis TaxID=2547811 RepID=A0A4R5VMR5_9BACI|nr:STAS domain-containing protein [Bacillus salipaludis]TDK59444.1 STAS domain-containing protein [Bacillus salipaludis]